MNTGLSARISHINARLSDDIKAKVQHDWLKDCVAYFLNDNPSMDNKLLYSSVLEQYTLANMSDTSHPAISATFQSKKDPWTLKESMLLQMQYIVDICKLFNGIFTHPNNSLHSHLQLNLFTINGETYITNDWTRSLRIRENQRHFTQKRNECLSWN